ncbi:SET and MYND domain-containing protein 3 [Geranomyces variabilis]|uniref:SET and MYND domain-containing protein 3 n=1 Tax=Geranomyces variabilis TaxID=109894 RepID=A0AAD5XP40_9FUNG|nr:SET and MYND domain-containing protein 3 [Geranomyces variabilis]
MSEADRQALQDLVVASPQAEWDDLNEDWKKEEKHLKAIKKPNNAQQRRLARVRYFRNANQLFNTLKRNVAEQLGNVLQLVETQSAANQSQTNASISRTTEQLAGHVLGGDAGLKRDRQRDRAEEVRKRVRTLNANPDAELIDSGTLYWAIVDTNGRPRAVMAVESQPAAAERSRLHRFLAERNLALLPDPLKRRKLTATVPLTRGTLALSSPPIATALHDKWSYCNWCLTLGSNGSSLPAETAGPTLTRCASCKLVLYCDAECQRQDWTAGHSICCKLWRLSGREEQGWELEYEMLVKISRALTRASREEADCDQADLVNAECFHTLQGHPSSSPQQPQQPPYWADIARAVARGGKGAYPVPTLITFLDVFRTNNHEVMDDHYFPIAQGTYPLASLLNHSCDPSCALTYDGVTLMLYAIRDVAPGEELTIAYQDPFPARETRRAHLKQAYGFHCVCARCEPESVDAATNGIALVDQCLGTTASTAVPQAWLECQSAVGLLASLYPLIMGTSDPVSVPHHPTDPPSTPEAFIRTTFAYLPPSILLLSNTAARGHARLVAHLSNPPHAVYSRDAYTELARKLKACTGEVHSRGTMLALYVACVCIVAYAPGAPLAASQLAIAATAALDALADERDNGCPRDQRDKATEVTIELSRVAAALCKAVGLRTAVGGAAR